MFSQALKGIELLKSKRKDKVFLEVTWFEMVALIHCWSTAASSLDVFVWEAVECFHQYFWILMGEKISLGFCYSAL